MNGYMYGLSPEPPKPFPPSWGTDRWVTTTACLPGRDCDEKCYLEVLPSDPSPTSQDSLGGGIGQHPPWWMSIPSTAPRAYAVLKNHPVLSPGRTLGIYSLLWPNRGCRNASRFMASGAYAWKHYDLDTGRPVAFALANGVGIGLADYLDQKVYETKIDPAYLELPALCERNNVSLTSETGAEEAATEDVRRRRLMGSIMTPSGIPLLEKYSPPALLRSSGPGPSDAHDC